MKIFDKFMLVLGGLVVFGFFFILALLVFVGIKEQNKDLLNIVIGALIGSFTSVVGYFFGSSQGSRIKTEMMNKQNDDKNTPLG